MQDHFYMVTGLDENLETVTLGIFNTKQKAVKVASNNAYNYENIRLWDYPPQE